MFCVETYVRAHNAVVSGPDGWCELNEPLGCASFRFVSEFIIAYEQCLVKKYFFDKGIEIYLYL